MKKIINTDKAPPPFSSYSQAVEIPANARLVFVSGQVGVTPDGELPDDLQTQHELCWENTFAVLEAAGMDKSHIVEVWTIVTDHSQIAMSREIRTRLLGHDQLASTTLVCGLANPDWKVEVAVRAAKVD